MVVSVKRAANAGYYFQGRDHLVVGGPEGVWVTGDSRALGVSRGEAIVARDLDRLLRRMTAHTGESPTFGQNSILSGHDIVFSAPKAVSLVWALDLQHRQVIEQAHVRAVYAAIEVLTHHAIRQRVGKGGRLLRPAIPAIGVFLHTRGRPAYHKETTKTFPDPSLHSHVLIPDLVATEHTPDCRLKVPYTTLYGRWAMAIGAWYHAHLAFHLRALGYRPIASGVNGVFTLEGVEQSWLAAFSARTTATRNLCRDLPLSQAFERTRQRAKEFEPNVLEGHWQELAQTLRCEVPRPLQLSGSLPWAGLSDALVEGVAAHLDEQSAVLQLNDLYRGLASYVVAEGIHLRPTTRMISEVVSNALFKPLPPSTSYGFEQWTTAANSRREEVVQEKAARLRRKAFPKAVLPAAGSMTGSQGIQLTPEQEAAAASIAGETRLTVLQGSPGTGKTSLLAPVLDSYKLSLGEEGVIGVAEAWLQALQLKSRFDIPSYSLASFLGQVRQKTLPRLGKAQVVIVDEAGLLSTKRMQELLEVTGSYPIKLIFLGDPQQLDPIGAGSGLRLINADAITVTAIHRQKTHHTSEIVSRFASIAGHRQRAQSGIAIDDERRAIREDIAALAPLLVSNGHWRASESSHAAITTIATEIVDRWASGQSPHGHRVLVSSHREAQQVTRIVREALRRAGYLKDTNLPPLAAVTPMGQRYRLYLAEGDYVRFLTRHKELGVYNGTEGYVRRITGTKNPVLEVQLLEEFGRQALPDRHASSIPPGRTVRFRPSDLANANGEVHLACAYAMTIYGAQGSTFEDVTILKSSRMAFRQLYVAVSRASQRFRIADVARDKHHWQASQDEKRLVHLVRLDLTAMEGRERQNPLASETARLRNSFRPAPAPWDWHVMVENTITSH